VGLVYLT